MEKILKLKNDIAQVEQLPGFVDDICDELALGPDKAFNLNLVLEEAVTNVIMYAFPQGEEHEFRVLATSNGKALSLVVQDDGVPFDPTTVAEVDTALSAEERPIGGLGIFLIRQIMSDVSYVYADGMNQLTMTLNLSK